MTKRFTIFLLIAALAVFACGGQAEDPPASKNKRIVYVVKNGAAKELAGILAKHFKGDAEIQALPESSSNCLLISAAPSVFDEIVKLLAQLDKRPSLVAIDVLVAEVVVKKGDDSKPLDEKDFTGPAQEVLSKVEALKRKGVIGDLHRFQLTGVENKPFSAMDGGTKPVVNSMMHTATGMTTRNITFRQVGTKVDAIARVGADKVITLELDVVDARLHVPDDGIVIGKDETGAPIRATEVTNTTLKSKLNIAAGQAVAAKAVQSDTKSGATQTLVIVTARIVE
jgi:Bacterial type II/III secretion system short domain